MDMHMVHLMYAPTDDVTVMVVPQHLRLSMDHLTRIPGVASIKSSFALKQVAYRTALPISPPGKSK